MTITMLSGTNETDWLTWINYMNDSVYDMNPTLSSDGGYDYVETNHSSLITPDRTSDGMDSDRISIRYTNVAFGFVLIALALLILWTIFGNIMVWCALYRVNHLKTLSNYLIGNLALCDFLLAALVLPMSAGYDLLGWWCFGERMCHFWLSIDVLCCTASIWSLLIISVDRLTATIYPIWYRDQHKKQRAVLYIALVWIFSTLVSVPPFFGWGDTISRAYIEGNGTEKPQCILFENQSYVIYSASGSFIIPLAAMACIYARIFLEIRKRMAIRHEKKVKHYRKHSSTTSTGSPEESEAIDPEGISMMEESTLYTTINTVTSDDSSTFEYSCPMPAESDNSYQISLNSNGSSSPRISPAATLKQFMKSPIDPKHTNGFAKSPSSKSMETPRFTYTLTPMHEENSADLEQDSNLLHVSGKLGTSSNSVSSYDSTNENGHQELKPNKTDRHVSIDENVNIKPCPAHKKTSNSKPKYPKKRGSSVTFPERVENVKRKMEEKARRRFDRREERATKIMATIMACFLVCWLPFFIMYITRSFCKNSCPIDLDLLSFIIWLGYANSGLNPILYTIFNEDFRNAFKNLLCPSLRTKRRR